ncbi:hypothetical protein HMPREF3293_00271 [Christensenella minuta]|uniref:Uncharacterized protein n=1 Tax=Christensenella minuta TaxID=626937 RepID=A0A136Q882_9FIRM|nr:hypothetical protein HMPREF3293_00271 [Christensenella minuta]
MSQRAAVMNRQILRTPFAVFFQAALKRSCFRPGGISSSLGRTGRRRLPALKFHFRSGIILTIKDEGRNVDVPGRDL